MWKIKDIFEGDFGCEERQPGERLKVIVELENESGETREVTAYDEFLRYNKLDVGSDWKEPTEAQRQLFWKQKHTMDTFLSTGALSREQYDFSLSGLIVKMGFDFDILDEEDK